MNIIPNNFYILIGPEKGDVEIFGKGHEAVAALLKSPEKRVVLVTAQVMLNSFSINYSVKEITGD